MKIMTILERLNQGDILIFDGAMGTQIQALQLNESLYGDFIGCNEVLNITAGHVIQNIHERYLLAGADVIETNTFGANRIVLSDYKGLENDIEKLNRLAVHHAREAQKVVDKETFIAGSLGPGTKLASLQQVDYATMYNAYAEQAQIFAEEKVDLFQVETCQDPLQMKIAIQAIHDIQKKYGISIPICVSMTIENNGALLVGSDLSAVVSILSPFKIDILGLNCATGPDIMLTYARRLVSLFNGFTLVMPNAGLPQNINGKMVYNLDAESFAEKMMPFIDELGVSLLGGCCGTSPAYIQALSNRIKQRTNNATNNATHNANDNNTNAAHQEISEQFDNKIQHRKQNPTVSSLYSARPLKKESAPFVIGERLNSHGCKRFKEALLSNNWDEITAIALEQEKAGADALDLCVAYPGRNECTDMVEIVQRLMLQSRLPLVIDTTDLNVMESALQAYSGHAIINSVNLENGEERAKKIFMLAHRYGASIIALTIDEKGMAFTTARKMEIVKRLMSLALECGLQEYDLIFDPLTFTLCSGDQSMKSAAIETLNALKQIHEQYPQAFTTLGVSNVSFGLLPASREVLNSVFLYEAIQSNLTTAIINVQKIIPLSQISEEEKKLSLDLLYNRNEDALMNLVDYFKKHEKKQKKVLPTLSIEEQIMQHVMDGNKSGLDELLKNELQHTTALDIVNNILLVAMKKIGVLFGSGKMQLPFVLKSAEVMKYAVDFLQPFMQKVDTQQETSLILATVRGDVHDIGKNLVDIILSNNGIKVYNLGIKCEIETILQKLSEVNADAIGLSGLLVKSTLIMKEYIEEMRQRGIDVPIVLGGAALNPNFVRNECENLLNSPIVYASDAFDTLKFMQSIQNNELEAYFQAYQCHYATPTHTIKDIPHFVASSILPTPPQYGIHEISNLSLDEIYNHITEMVLLRGRWGYRQRNMTDEEYAHFLEQHVQPELTEWKERAKEYFEPRALYGYFHCQREQDNIVLYDNEQQVGKFSFPRVGGCLADAFQENDIIALQLVTFGQKAVDFAHQLYIDNKYKDYLLFHGLAVETTDALANFVNEFINKEWNAPSKRYSFGYPSCPDLQGNCTICNILHSDSLNITINDSGEMEPEFTTAAFLVHS